MKMKIWAFIAFNIYAAFLISAFQENTAYLFDIALIKEMKLGSLYDAPRNWGWGTHYIWRLCASVVVTALVGFLAGAIAKSKGSLTATISNIPSLFIWVFTIYALGFSDVQVEEKTAFIIISIIAIPLTSYAAYMAGGYGQITQNNEFEENTILGVKPYHWLWAILPIYWYTLGIVYVTAQFIAFQYTIWGDTSTLISIMSLFALLPILAWGYPLLLVYRVLTGVTLPEKSKFVQCIANFSILILGMLFATGLQAGSYWLLTKMAS